MKKKTKNKKFRTESSESNGITHLKLLVEVIKKFSFRSSCLLAANAGVGEKQQTEIRKRRRIKKIQKIEWWYEILKNENKVK